MSKLRGDRRHSRRERAIERNEYWGKLSFEAQLLELAGRPGRCTKQMQKIRGKIEKRDATDA